MTISSELICKCLQSLDRRERQRALNDLLEFAVSRDSKNEDIIRVYDETYLYILKCYSDKYESCRELACTVVTEIFKHLPNNDYYLQYVVSTICSRIGQKESIEESEELRFLLLSQLDSLIDKYRTDDLRKDSDLLLKSYDEIVNILIKELRDDYPSAQRAACACIRTLAEATSSFHYRAEVLVKPLIPMLHHKHSMNRVSAIESLGIASLHIMTDSDCISQIIMEISPLLMDPMPLVRKECGKTGCRMLIDLRDRYSFFPRILPLVLCCLNDDMPDVRDHIQNLWTKCGEQYYEENASELSKKEIVDEIPSRYPDDIKRPNLGCRAIVQRSLRIVQLVLTEITDWKDDVRLHSLKLLWQIVLHAEFMIAVHVLDIFPVIARACADAHKNISIQSLKCAELMGTFMIYKEWFTSCFQLLQENPKLGYLKCFYSMLSAAISHSFREDKEHIAKILQGRDFANSLNCEFQMYILKFVNMFVDERDRGAGISETLENLSLTDTEDKTDEYLYQTTIKVVALSYGSDDEVLKRLGEETLMKLAKYDQNEIMALHGRYLATVLATFDCLDADNDANAEPILLLHGVICVCGFQFSYMELLKKCILTVWEHGSSDAKVKILSAVSIAMMSWSGTINIFPESSLKSLKDFINDVVLPHLTWQPGISAEGLRTLATATLCSMAQGAQKEAPEILSGLVTIFPALVEDNSATTRVYALRTLANIGPIKLDELRKLGYAVVQRLDDPSSEVREWAARSIINIRVDDNEIDEGGKASVRAYMADIFSTLFLHFEGPEVKLRKAIKSSIISLGKSFNDVFIESFNKAYAMTTGTAREELDEIKLLVAS